MSDLISRQAAIETVMECYDNDELFEVYEDKLRELPPAQPEQLSTNLAEVGTDCISRHAAIKATWQDTGYTDPFNVMTAIRDRIQQLPPSQPERIKGHWIESKGLNTLMKKFIEKGETWRVCDKCGAGFMIGYQYECDKLYHETFHNFCPKCGAEMEVTT